MCIIIPLIFFLVFDNIYAINILHKQITESEKNTLSLYMRQIDSDLNNLDEYLLNIDSLDIYNYGNSDENQKYLSGVSILYTFRQGIAQENLADGFFVYSNQNNSYIYTYSSRTEVIQRASIIDYLSKNINKISVSNDSKWIPIKIGSSYYIFRIYEISGNYVGAWVNITTLMSPLKEMKLINHSYLLFSTNDGKPMNNEKLIENEKINLSGNLEGYYFKNTAKYFVIGTASDKGAFRLMQLTEDESILQGLNLMQKLIVFIAFLSILLLPISLYVLRKIIFLPMSKLKTAIDTVQSGNLNFKIKDFNYSAEFITLYNAFNNMVSQIQQFKIEVYEKQIEKQKLQLQYMQMQIKPHFYLNAFNTIYSMAQMKEYDLIQDMIRYLSDYLRYMCQSTSYVRISDELIQIRNYLQIQKLRSGLDLNCSIEIDQILMDCIIPPLIIHTFIENILKYAIKENEETRIMIKVMQIENVDSPKILINIRDNGKGFSQKALNDINAEMNNMEKTNKIGIWNVKQRLKLIYGDEAGIIISNNQESGANVEMTLPLRKSEV
jgi:Putative regulator of cell autolysis